jgi:hypothetical protein
LLIDCRSLEIEHTRCRRPCGLVINSGMPRQLVDSAYAERRRVCEMAAARLGLSALRDATPEQVADEPRARHVVSENARVLAAAEALSSGDLPTLGRLLSESHASLRDETPEVSTPELDVLAEKLSRPARWRPAHRRRLRGCVAARGRARSPSPPPVATKRRHLPHVHPPCRGRAIRDELRRSGLRGGAARGGRDRAHRDRARSDRGRRLLASGPRESGLLVLVYVNTDRYCAKE